MTNRWYWLHDYDYVFAAAYAPMLLWAVSVAVDANADALIKCMLVLSILDICSSFMWNNS